MRIRNFESQLWLPRPREEVFAFSADAANLDRLTPAWLKFHTTTSQPIVPARRDVDRLSASPSWHPDSLAHRNQGGF
jgi:ligand-binding SRPBCC domain-containing protein